jgi:hypothetical protein
MTRWRVLDELVSPAEPLGFSCTRNLCDTQGMETPLVNWPLNEDRGHEREGILSLLRPSAPISCDCENWQVRWQANFKEGHNTRDNLGSCSELSKHFENLTKFWGSLRW